jgi:hypothetical protein
MFKNMILAVLITIVLTYSLGHLATQWLDLHISFVKDDFEPIASTLVLTGIVAIMVVMGCIVAFSIFAAIAFVLVTLCIGLFVTGISVFWPIILVTLVVFLLVKNKQTVVY